MVDSVKSLKHARNCMRNKFISMNCTVCTAKMSLSPRASTYLLKSSICLITCCIAANHKIRKCTENLAVQPGKPGNTLGRTLNLYVTLLCGNRKIKCVLQTLEYGNLHLLRLFAHRFYHIWYMQQME